MIERGLFFVVFILAGSIGYSNPVFQKVVASGQSVGIYEKYELTIDMDAKFNNPFDYDEISLQAVFRSPSGKKYTVDGFWYEDFSYKCDPVTFDESLKDLGVHHWKVRFTPFMTGTWSVTLSCTDMQGTSGYQQNITFNCTPDSRSKGFIRKANRMYLKYDNGDFYFPVNMNMGWCSQHNTTICSYKDWIDQFSSQGGNNMRIMANSYWSISIEKHEKDKHYTPGNYSRNMDEAYFLDVIMEYAAQKGVNVELSMDNVTLYRCRSQGKDCYFQDENPYYCGNLDHTVYINCALDVYDCFRTNKVQPYKTLMKWQSQRTRYMIARWGYAVNLESWELMNEINLMPELAGNSDHVNTLIDYLNYQISLIDKLDIYHHLVTVSGGGELLSSEANPNSDMGFQYQMFRLPGIDYVCHHKYSLNTASNSNSFKPERLPAYIGGLIPQSLDAFRKPVTIDETLWPDRQEYPENDPRGVLCHNVIWTSAFSGSMGSASPWDWVPVLWREPPPNNKYFCPGYLDQIGSLAGYMRGLNLLDQDYLPYRMDDKDVPFRGYYLRGKSKTYGYVQNKEYDWETLYLNHRQFLMDEHAPADPASGYYPASLPKNTICNIPVGTSGSYKVTFYTCDGQRREIDASSYKSQRKQGEKFIAVQLPAVDWDITFVAEEEK